MGFPDGSAVKNPPANAGDSGLIRGTGRSPGEGNGNPLQYPCLPNPVDRGTWLATAHGVTKESDMTYRLNNNKKPSLKVISCWKHKSGMINWTQYLDVVITVKDFFWIHQILSLCSPVHQLCVFSHFSCVWLFVPLLTVAFQVPLSMGFSRQEYWVGYHTLLQGFFPTQGSNPCLLRLLHHRGGFFTAEPPGKPRNTCAHYKN